MRKQVGRPLTWALGALVALGMSGCGGADSTPAPASFQASQTGAEQSAFDSLGADGSMLKRHTFVATGRTLVRITFGSKAMAQELADEGLDLFYHSSTWAVTEVNAKQLEALRARPELRVERLSPKDGFSIQNNFDQGYHTYVSMTAELQDLAAKNPNLVQLSSLGKSWEGSRDIWALRIGGPGSPDQRPGVVYMGAHHAREIVTPEICIRLAHLLVDQYGKDKTLTDLVNSRDIWIVPMVNPDGHVLAEQGNDWRKNTDHTGNGALTGGPDGPGTDLNRNYGYKWGQAGAGSSPDDATYRGKAAFSEPETQAIRALFLAHHNIKLSMSYHTFSNLVLWPWGYTNGPAPDKALLEAIGKKLASYNGYTAEQGSDLYITSGDSDDWIYGQLKIPAFTTEIGGWDDYFDPPFSSMNRFWDENRPGALYLLQIADNPKAVLNGR